jgi:hypothetical protein
LPGEKRNETVYGRNAIKVVLNSYLSVWFLRSESGAPVAFIEGSARLYEVHEKRKAALSSAFGADRKSGRDGDRNEDRKADLARTDYGAPPSVERRTTAVLFV